MPANELGSPSASNSYLLVPIILFFVLLIVAVLRSPSLVSNAGIGSAVIVATPLVLATYAVMAIAIAGRATVDLSIGPLIGFINVTLVQLFGAEILTTPADFFLYAIGIGVIYQLIIGLIIVYVRVQPIIVALSGFLALSGINLVIMVRPEGTAPDWMAPWGLGTSIYSPVSAILVLSTAAWLLFSRTAFYGHLRLMGSDERAAFTSGVRINLVRLGAHVIAGIYGGLAALTYTSLIGSGDPTQGTTYTLVAVTALVLGGASLAGGRGGVIGSLFGAVNIYLITYVLATFNFGKVQSFVTDLSYGTVLVISLLLTVVLPHIQASIRYISVPLLFVVLSLVAIGVSIHATYDYSRPASASANSTAAQPGQGFEPAAASAASLKAQAVEQQTLVGEFIFEDAQQRASLGDRSIIARPVALAAVLLLSLLIILRVIVSQASAKALSPLIYVVVAAVILLGVYVVANPTEMAGTSGMKTGQSTR